MNILTTQQRFNWTITRDAHLWRGLHPHSGVLLGERTTILATDGCLAAFTRNWDTLFIGHLANFVGPVAYREVWEEDWDWDRNKQRVNVFRRKDGSLVIIPVDTFMTTYWEKRAKITADELALEAALVGIENGRLVRGSLAVEDFDKSLAQLREARSAETPAAGRKALREARANVFDSI